MTVIALCRQHAPAPDLVALWRTLGARWVGEACSGFFDGAVEIWSASPAKFQGVELVIPEGTHLVRDMTRTMCIGPHCQCASVWDTWGAAPNKCIRKVASRQTERPGRFDSVPRYVVAKAAQAVKEEAQALRGGSLFEPTSLAQVPPRFSLRPSAARTPAGLDETYLFRSQLSCGLQR